MKRRTALLLAASAPALAQAPLRFVVPYAPGGGADQAARLLAGPLGAELGQTILVENRTGGGGSIGAGLVAQARPDGLTLLVDSSAHVANHVLLRGLPFDYARDFAPVAQLTVLPMLLIVPASESAPDLASWMARLRESPGSMSYASAGTGTASHLTAALFLRAAGLQAVEVSYRGGSQATQDVVAGNLAFSMATMASALPLVQGGRLRALAVTTMARLPALPDVPTLDERALPGFDAAEWIALYAPAATPPALLERLHAAVRAVLLEPRLRQRLLDAGALPGLGGDRAAFVRYVADKRAETTALLARSGITGE